MKTYPDCIPCLFRQALNAMRLCGAEDSDIFRAMRRIMKNAEGFDDNLTPPEMAMRVHRIVRDECKCEDPYRAVKAKAIREVLRREDTVRRLIDASPNPFRAAVRFALAGNALDFAIFDWNAMKLDDHLNSALEKKLDESALDRLEAAVKTANDIMIIGDNAGESVLDKLLMERMPDKKIVYAVRGGPAINDTTMEDAKASGLDKVARLIENGSDAPGTLLRLASEEFLECFRCADLVISKGQGNYESLSDAPRKIFFLTQIKCPVITRDLKGRVGDWVIAESNPDAQ